MKIIIVPGESPKNKRWVEKIEKFLRLNKKYDVLSAKYSHWNSEKAVINLKKESVKLGNMLSLSEEYLIVAKSAGILVSIKAFLSGEIKPKSFIFLGLPLKWATEKKIDTNLMFNKFSASALIIQNDKDPFASATEVGKFLTKLEKSKDIQLIKASGDTHEYEDFELISSFVNKIK